MMIPPVAVATPPDDARQNPEDGFTEAMAVALAAMPVQTRWAVTDTPTPVIPSVFQPVQIGQGMNPITVATPDPDPITPGVIPAGSTEWSTASWAEDSTVLTAVAPASTTTGPTPDGEPTVEEPIAFELVAGELGAVPAAEPAVAGSNPERATGPEPERVPVIRSVGDRVSQAVADPRDISVHPDIERAEPSSLQTPSPATGAATKIRPDLAVDTGEPQQRAVPLPSEAHPEMAQQRDDLEPSPTESQKPTPDLAVSGRSAAGFEMPTVESIGTSGPSVEESRAGRVPSAMLQRVEEVVRALEHAPPPRSMTLTVDEEGLTRITVSLTTDGIRLSVPEGSSASPRLLGDLEQALSSRGFDLSRDGRQREQDRHDQAEGFVASRPERRAGRDGVRL